MQADSDLFAFKGQDENDMSEIRSIRVAYIDLIDNGELLKETFDVKKSPRFVLIKNNTQFPYVSKDNHLRYNELSDLVKYKHKKPKQPQLAIRPLVDENFLPAEYAYTTVGEWFMENDGPKHMKML
eukprot:CAMPEP_0176370668 /NCGR_PEP_ID=MMETSP0126-20121128/24157_1 /TAXON_ID=141414 ORGANISM="Strombidinopsis acuminatum, Strain SPMC142" /NCGR_SAMPLE_ID=MMETSP0126 /ASSEMBLY_ACC=CAM_ASM_000229 /LENGTH=125 /DNA_ID=CAMNT_0017729813 /DNA_START=347 /DNA_END=724 /DNA_ORIENTATION=-